MRTWSNDLKNYLLSIQQESEDFLERKLIIVGPEGVGKSLYKFKMVFFSPFLIIV